MRPKLRPYVPLIWRTDDLLQFGTDPARARAMPCRPAEHTWLTGLDGGQDLDGTFAQAARSGIDARTAHHLFQALADAAAFEDAGQDVPELRTATVAERSRLAPDVAAIGIALGPPSAGTSAMSVRRRSRVEVRGSGRVGGAVAVLLAATGIGAVSIEDRPTSEQEGPLTAGAESSSCLRAAIERCAPATRVLAADQTSEQADVVVLADRPHVDPAEVAELVAADVPHLLVHAAGSRAVIGPLVIPGRTACLRCVHLARKDRDSTWPRQSAQLVRLPEPTAVDSLLATLAAAIAARRVCGVLESHGSSPPGAGQAVEFDLLTQRFTSRSWSPHPICGCTWRG